MAPPNGWNGLLKIKRRWAIRYQLSGPCGKAFDDIIILLRAGKMMKANT